MPLFTAETTEEIMQKFYKSDQVKPESVQALPRPRSAEIKKPVTLLKQRVLAAQLRLPVGDEWQQKKAELLAALRPRG